MSVTVHAHPTIITETRRYVFTIDGVEPMTAGAGGPQFLPASLVITWTGVTGGQWARRVRVVGPRLKADGTPGKAESSTTIHGTDVQPDWVADAIRVTTPSKDPR